METTHNKNHLLNIIDSFIPKRDPFTDAEVRRKSRMVVGISLLFGSLLILGITLDILFQTSPHKVGWFTLNRMRAVLSGSFFFLAFSFRYAKHHQLHSVAVLLQISLILIFMSVVTGGVLSPGIFLTVAIPFLSTFLLGHRSGLIAWLVLTIIGILLFIGHKQGLLPPPPAFAHSPIQFLRMYMLLLAVSGGFMWLYENSRHKSMQELKESHENNLALILARDRAQQANQTKSEFLANMSHELRTPLNAIIGYTEILFEDVEFDDNKQYLPDLHKINQAGHNLLELINDILDLSKIEAGHMELFYEQVSLPPFLDKLGRSIAVLVEKNHNQFDVIQTPDATHIETDSKRLRQILLNLLSNAAKFTHEGQITLSTRRFSNPSGKEFIEFEVKDNGIGMSELQLESVFDKFTQADSSSTRKYGGTGLGLSISKELCELMGGELTVQSELHKGTTFRLVLPLHPKRSPQQITPSKEQFEAVGSSEFNALSQSNRPIALVIDDDIIVLDLLGRLLKEEGYQVIATSIGNEAVAIAKQIRPHLITLDVMMPVLGGWDILKQLKADEELNHIPVIMISIVDEKEKGFSLGAAEYINKPFSRDDLRLVFRKYQQTSPSHVLIVEDDEHTRELANTLLTKEGWHTTLATNGIEALEALEHTTPNLILLDLMMPEMDGFQFLQRLRSHEQLPLRSLPVIIFTAKELTPEEKQRLSIDAQRVLLKGTSEELQSSTQALRESIRQLLPPHNP